MTFASAWSHVVYLTYLEDAGTTGKNLADKEQPFQVMCAVIVHDKQFSDLEEYLAAIASVIVEDTESFEEFHSLDLLQGNKPFQGLKREKGIETLDVCLGFINAHKVPIVYGAVDKRKLSAGIYATSDPVDIAFRLCMDGVEKWFTEKASDELGLLIADDNKEHRNAIHNAFRQYRRRVKVLGHNRGRLAHMHDDMYFGDSKYSKGIQLADMCALVIARHLSEKADTASLYKDISKFIYHSKVEPE